MPTGSAGPPPTVTSVSPDTGRSNQTQAVTITGTGFTGATGVTFGGVAATGVTVVNDTTITCTTPTGTAGSADVSVAGPGGTGTLSSGYFYLDASSLRAWYRMDLGATTTPAPGATITALADQSGTGDAAKNLASAGGAPSYTSASASYNNKAIATFAGTSRLEGSGAWASSQAQPLTIYAVGRSISGGGRLVDGMPGHRAILMDVSGTWNLYAGASFVVDTGGTSCTSPAVLCGVFDATSAIYVNRHTTAGASGGAGTDTLTQAVIGALGGGGGELYGDVAEIIVYGGAHGQAKRQEIMAYLGTRYGITVTA